MNAVTLLALAIAPAAPALKEKAAPEPTIVGEWAAESVTVGGKPATPGTDRWVFRAGGTMAMMSQGTIIEARDYGSGGEAPVRDLDMGRPGGRGSVNLARYPVEGDTLTLSVGHGPDVRPADLEPGPKVTVWVFKRTKDK